MLIQHNKTELVLPREGQIYKDRYRKGDMLRAVVQEVHRDSGSAPQVVVSRTAPIFVERLFELEVPEIYDGLIEITRVVREPGDRAKMTVLSHDPRVDPVGACVGVKGSRIHAVVRELGGENIDVIPHTDDPVELVKRAMQPAKPIDVELRDDLVPPRARVTVAADEVSMAIGRGGQNIRLASRLCGYEIDVYRNIKEDEEDVEIEEFSDVLPDHIIHSLKDIGCDTAKAVLELSPPELARRSGLDEEQARKVMLLMRYEFAEGAERESHRERRRRHPRRHRGSGADAGRRARRRRGRRNRGRPTSIDAAGRGTLTPRQADAEAPADASPSLRPKVPSGDDASADRPRPRSACSM